MTTQNGLSLATVKIRVTNVPTNITILLILVSALKIKLKNEITLRRHRHSIPYTSRHITCIQFNFAVHVRYCMPRGPAALLQPVDIGRFPFQNCARHSFKWTTSCKTVGKYILFQITGLNLSFTNTD